MSIPASSWCGTGIAVPKDEKANWARYSERLPWCRLAAIEPVMVIGVVFFLLADKIGPYSLTIGTT
jgi:hypothetical protein